MLRASTTLQEYLHIFNRWLQKWKIKVNVTKSSYLTFTLRNEPSPPIYLNEVEIPPAKTVKYLRLHLDTKLNWREHITKKRKQMDLRYKELYWLLGRSSPSQSTINISSTKPSLHLYGPMTSSYGAVHLNLT